jgi:hypothetical protein
MGGFAGYGPRLTGVIRDLSGSSTHPQGACIRRYSGGAAVQIDFVINLRLPIRWGSIYRLPDRTSMGSSVMRTGYRNPSSSTGGEVREALTTYIKLAASYVYLHRIHCRAERNSRPFSDAALAPLDSDQPGAFARRRPMVDAAAASAYSSSRPVVCT